MKTAPQVPEDAEAVTATPGEALRARRRALALTGVQFAAALGCCPDTLGRAETGRYRPPRPFWQRADGMLSAGGELLRLYDGAVPGTDPVWPVHDLGRRP